MRAENSTAAVVVAGHICLDITPDLRGQSKQPLSTLFKPGKLVRSGTADVHTGGCVANAGLALQKLGMQTKLIARIGADAFGDIITRFLKSSGADHALIRENNGSTSYSVVLAPPGVDRIFIHHAGANEHFKQADVPDSLLAGAKLLHFGYPPLMPGMCEHNGAPIQSLFSRAKALGLITSLDMAAIDPSSQAAQTDWESLLSLVLPHTDCFLPSAEELCFMLDKPRYNSWQTRAHGGDITDILDIQTDIAPLANRLLDMGTQIAVIKCGAKGLYLRTTGDCSKVSEILSPALWVSKAIFQPAFIPQNVVSATGAGDTSIAAFLASLLTGLPPDVCLKRAAATGACCVEQYDAISGLLPFPALDNRIMEGWKTTAD